MKVPHSRMIYKRTTKVHARCCCCCCCCCSVFLIFHSAVDIRSYYFSEKYYLHVSWPCYYVRCRPLWCTLRVSKNIICLQPSEPAESERVRGRDLRQRSAHSLRAPDAIHNKLAVKNLLRACGSQQQQQIKVLHFYFCYFSYTDCEL